MKDEGGRMKDGRQMTDDGPRTRLDELLELLTDEIAARLEARRETGRAAQEEGFHEPERAPEPPAQAVAPVAAQMPEPETTPLVLPSEMEWMLERDRRQESEQAAEPEIESAPLPELPVPSHAASLMARLAIGVLIIVILINIPLNAQGIALARSIPSSASLVIANGLVVKEASSPDIYVYRDDAFHWITSLEAFDYFGYRWEQVHIVEPGFLNQFPKGKPLYVLLKCNGSPHIYRLEGGQKRWIVDILTFEAEGHVWEDVKMVTCPYLRSLPDGESVPPGRGTPEPPLP